MYFKYNPPALRYFNPSSKLFFVSLKFRQANPFSPQKLCAQRAQRTPLQRLRGDFLPEEWLTLSKNKLVARSESQLQQ